MLNDPSQSLEAANLNSVVSHAATIDNLIEPVAKLWCRSFGISDTATIDRLKLAIEDEAHQALASGGLDRVQHRLDSAAEKIIREWFAYVLNRDIPSSGKYLAVLRLAFLDCNYESKWSSSFLLKDFCVQELSAELQTMMIMPTPQANPRSMIRQAI
ncbi:MAG: hypothetical protein V4691_10275 [Pseudomonadota bacterium]